MSRDFRDQRGEAVGPDIAQMHPIRLPHFGHHDGAFKTEILGMVDRLLRGVKGAFVYAKVGHVNGVAILRHPTLLHHVNEYRQLPEQCQAY